MNILFFLMLAIIAFLLIIITTFIYFGRKVVFIDAMELYKKGHEEEALDKLRSYVKTKKNDIKAKEFLAKIYLERGEVQNALKENVGITLSSASNNVEKSRAYGQMVKIYFDEKNYNKAIATAGKALKYNKQNVDVYFYLGKIYLVMDKERRANKMFNEVLKYDRNSIECRMELAELHIKEKSFTKARFHLKKILEIDDQNDQARFRLGEIFYAEDQLDDAAKEFEMIKNIEGKENLYYRVLSEYFLKIQNLERAEFILEKMLNEKPQFFGDIKINLEYSLANIYEIKERYEEALELYKNIKEKNARYKDVEDRVKNLMKFLNPDEFKAILNEIDFAEINHEEFIEMAKKMIDKMGMLFNYQIEETSKIFAAVISDKYSMSHTKTKYLFLITRSEEISPRDLQKFMDKMNDNKIDHGIYVTLGEYSESAIEFAATVQNLEILDKVHVHDIVGQHMGEEEQEEN